MRICNIYYFYTWSTLRKDGKEAYYMSKRFESKEEAFKHFNERVGKEATTSAGIYVKQNREGEYYCDVLKFYYKHN